MPSSARSTPRTARVWPQAPAACLLGPLAPRAARARPQAPARRESRRETWHRPVPGPQLEDPAARSRAAPPQVRPAEFARGTGDLSRKRVKSPGLNRETSPKNPELLLRSQPAHGLLWPRSLSPAPLPPPRPLHAMGGGGNATEEATAGMRGDPDEFRCALFRSRQLQRQQQQAWLQQAFAGWDWASFARKAREHRALSLIHI